MNTKERLLLFILAAVNFTHIMDFMIMMPLGPQLMNLLNINPQQFGLAVSAYAITAGASSFVSAFFVDRFDRKKVLLFAYIGFTVGTFSCALAPNYELLVAARVLAGLFGGMIGAQVLAIVADTFGYERRARAMGILMTSFSLASVAGVPAGLWLAAKFSWHIPFVAIGALGVIVAILIALFVPPVNAHLDESQPAGNPLRVLTDIFQTPNQMKALSLSTVLMLGHFSIIPFIAPSLVGNIGYDEHNIFLIYLVGGALTMFTAPLVGKVADRRGKYPVFVTFALLSLIPVWLITNLWPMPLWGVLLISGLFFIFVNGRMIPMQAIVSGVVTPQQRGGFMSINSSVQQLATGLAAMIGGAIVHKTADGHIEHYAEVGYISILLIAASIWLAGRVKPIEDANVVQQATPATT
ncbi:MAG: Purine efflux pump PbuE [Saprospiraceae bacterium]|nr:Purine efflux pump PbuE [Saprospiraceae bacterium]